MTEFYTHCGDERYFEFDGKVCDEETGMELDVNSIVRLLNENEQLKKEKENWKSSACNNSSFNSILINELSIAQEQGYKVSDPFKKLMEDKGDFE